MKLVIEKIYCLYCPAFPLRGKVGISGNVEQRRQSIEQEIRGRFGGNIRVRCLLKVPILTSAYTFEQAIHNALDGLPYWRCETMKGTNGHTEWRWCPNWVCGILTYLLFWGFGKDCGHWAMVAAVIIPIPLDLILCVLLMAGAEYAMAAGIIYLIYGLLT